MSPCQGRRTRRAALTHVVLLLFVGTGAQGVAQTPPTEPPDSALFFVKGRGYGTDAYAGPFDVILNKGLAVAQWRGKSKDIFDYPYGWHAVWKSVTDPGPAVEHAGGWGEVLRLHFVPFSEREISEAQWVPNYFGHVFEGGLAYRRLLEWNRVHDVPLPTLTAVVVTQFAVALNEAYETPIDDPFVQENGTAGAFLDFAVFDPLGMLLMHQDGVARFVAEKLGAVLWPRQASIVFPGALLQNNGETFVVRPPLWIADRYRFFVRGGIGIEGGISMRRDDGLEISVGGGLESYQRDLDPERHVESAGLGLSAGMWIDRGGALLFSASWTKRTDRRFAIDVFPGVLSVAGTTFGAWFLLDGEHRPYFGFTGRRTLGVGLGIGL